MKLSLRHTSFAMLLLAACGGSQLVEFPEDAGTLGVRAPVIDSSTGSTDTGKVTEDSAPPPPAHDAGKPPRDSGTPVADAGNHIDSGVIDSGVDSFVSPPADAGSRADVVTVIPDTGSSTDASTSAESSTDSGSVVEQDAGPGDDAGEEIDASIGEDAGMCCSDKLKECLCSCHSTACSQRCECDFQLCNGASCCDTE